MTGQNIVDLLTKILGDEEIDQTFALQMINTARAVIEDSRPWQVLKKKDTSITVNGSNTYTTPHAIPSDFKYYLGDGSIQLFDGTNFPQIATEFPYEDLLQNKDTAFQFCADYGSSIFYITGVLPSSYTVYQWYIYDPGDITLTTQWLRFPARFHPYLAYMAAAMWRLGTDWDDVNARNADENYKQAILIGRAMEIWDARLTISQIKNIEYPQNFQGKTSSSSTDRDGRYGPRGTRRRG